MKSKFITFFYLVLFFFTPLILTSYNSELFELPKMYFVYALTLAIVITHLVNFIRGQAPLFRHTFLDFPLVLFLLSQIISTIFSVDVHTSIFGYYSRLNGGLLSLIAYVLLYWVFVIYLNDDFKNKLLNFSLASGLLVAGYGILEHFGIDKNIWIQDVQNRVFSTLGQPNWLAAYLCILLPLSLHQFFKSTRLFPRFYYFSLTFSFYLCLLYTKSKSGIIAGIVAIGFYFLFHLLTDFWQKTLVSHRRSYFIFLLFILLSLAVGSPIRDVFFPISTVASTIPPTLNITPSEDIRKIVWQGSLELWKLFPLFGTGPETFAYTYYWTRPASHNLTSEWDFLYNKAHNEYLNYLSTTGSFGFITYLLLIAVILYQLRTSLKNDSHLAVIAAFISILITNLAGFSVVITSLFFFICAAFLISPLNSSALPAKNNFRFFALIPLFICFFGLIQVLYFYLADITYSQALALDESRRSPAALDQIHLSLRYRPDEPEYLIEYANILSKLALNSYNLKDTDSAQAYADETLTAAAVASKISPFNLNFWKQKAQAYYYLSGIDTKYYLLAIDAMTKATKLAPTDAKSFYMLGEFYQNINNIDDSLINYHQALKLKPNYDYAAFALGKIYLDRKDYTLAKTYFDQTLLYAPNNTDAQNYLRQIATQSASKSPSLR